MNKMGNCTKINSTWLKQVLLFFLGLAQIGAHAELGFYDLIPPTNWSLMHKEPYPVLPMVRNSSQSVFAITTLDHPMDPNSGRGVGTAVFVLRDNRSSTTQFFLSALHNVSGSINSRIQPAFNLFSFFDGDVVQQLTGVQSSASTLAMYNQSPTILPWPGRMERYRVDQQISDLALMQLGQTDLEFPGVRIARRLPADNERIYIMGFPRRTTNRPAGLNSAGGGNLYVSVGKKLPVADGLLKLAEFKQISSEQTVDEWSAARDNLVVVDADCVPGNSGGPMLNADGEVFAIVTTYAERGSPPYESYCFGVQVTNLSQLRRAWQTLAASRARVAR